MYADNMTDSMKNAISETDRRRKIQQKYNDEHGITPQTIKKAVRDLIAISKEVTQKNDLLDKDDLEKKMRKAAVDLDFESAAELRDQMLDVRKRLK